MYKGNVKDVEGGIISSRATTVKNFNNLKESIPELAAKRGIPT